jgi:putative ABC transport system permease protein
MLLKLHTAWLQLKYEKTRLAVALSGVVFAVVIIFMQLGIQDALFDSAVRLHQSLRGDCFLISPRSASLVAMDSLTERRLLQTLAFQEVEFVSPIYVEYVQWQNPNIKNYWRNIFLIGIDLRNPPFNLPGIEENLNKLKIDDRVLFDRGSRKEYGTIVEDFLKQGIVTTEVRYYDTTRKIKVVGLFDLGTSFGIDGNILTSHLNFFKIIGKNIKGFINIGVIKLKPGTDVETFIEKLKNYLPKDVKVLSKRELMDWEKDYWNRSTPIGFVFSLGVILGLVVGVVVVYQILYTNVSEHLSEYATLKAMGYRHQYLLSMVLQQSAFIALLGYLPGFVIAEILYKLTHEATMLPIGMTLSRAVSVVLLTLVMCFLAGSTAVKKLAAADPADIF